MATALAGTWIWPPGRAIWNQVDDVLFRFANGALSFAWWRSGWAALNHRWCDIAGIVLFASVLLYAGRYGRRSLRRSAISIAVLAALVLGLRGATHLVVSHGKPEFKRPSPTLVHDDALRLSALVPEIEAKDESRWSFPGDHGFVVLTLLLYLGYRGPDRAVHLATLLALVFTVPRLVSGAHWFSDIAVGSAVMALVTTGILMATPLHDWAVNRLDAMLRLPRRAAVEG